MSNDLVLHFLMSVQLVANLSETVTNSKDVTVTISLR
jgi:hypothetical protein